MTAKGQHTLCFHWRGRFGKLRRRDSRQVEEGKILTQLLQGTTLIVADAKVHEAAEALRTNGLEPCNGGENCDWENDALTEEASSPAPYHFHLDHGPQGTPPFWCESLKLYKKSDIDPKLPDPGLEVPGPGDRNYMVVTDPRLPQLGHWKSSTNPVQILSKSRFFETMFNQAVKCHANGLPDDHLTPWEWNVFRLKQMGDGGQPNSHMVEGLELPARRYIELLNMEDLKSSRDFIAQVRLERGPKGL
ncbi:uncharacterized protein AKAW2_40498A [Aspergillus luchuensis]|uniref:Uncharacterized protein n=1 Tax=Aspergillus kawachii TaxID=1069201 RepID=A0A7R7W9J4_ASPKA|nr:uncharacterized protein AKAW2_40498A [Aspergillus luchuensis]BCR98815.1 hypothetical protein AKAW2_40498A [Aspergillus luchuensis]BCS11132.1 hypothetical protein ALUC_40472A [Aspergillus luchuensis]